MSRVEVTRRVRFEAAHFLPDHEGDCRQLHGHSWSAEVTLAGPLGTDGPHAGMVCDMGDVARLFRNRIEPYADHGVLNDVMPAAFLPPTTENVARWLLHEYAAAGFPVVRVTVRETENQTATAYREG